METSEQKGKYYTPKIEEFHVGFEYEALQFLSDPVINPITGQVDLSEVEHTWIPQRVELLSEISSILCITYQEGKNPVESIGNSIRVKYLDREDIESLGFIPRLKNQWIGWKDFVMNIKNPRYEYFYKVTLHVPTMGDQYKILVHRNLADVDNIEDLVNYGESEVVYKGLLKNKSKLKLILKQTNIFEDE